MKRRHTERSRVYSTELKLANFSLIAGYRPTLYVPQVIGTALARGLGLPPLGIFYTARLLNEHSWQTSQVDVGSRRCQFSGR